MVEKKAEKEVPKGFTPAFDYLPSWEKKYKVPAAEIKQRILDKAKLFMEKRKDWNEETCHSKARLRVHSEIKAVKISTTGDWMFRCDWKSTPMNFNAKMVEHALEVYHKDPRKAIKDGLVKEKTDVTGTRRTPIPLDTRKTFGKGENAKENKNFGKPIALRNYSLRVGGIAIPATSFDADEWEQLRPCEIKIGKSKADPEAKEFIGKELERGKWYNTNLINKTEKDTTDEWKLSGSASTKFVPSKTDLDVSEGELLEYYASFFTELGGLAEYHEAWMNDPDPEKPDRTSSYRLVVTKGQVIDIQMIEGQNTHIIIDDESLEKSGDEDDVIESIHLWVPEDILINFGKFSEIIVFGNTSCSKRKDLTTGDTLEEWGLPSINVTGIIVTELVEPEVEDEEAGDEVEDAEAEEEEVEPQVDINKTEEVKESPKEEQEETKPEEESQEPEEEPEQVKKPAKKASTPKKSTKVKENVEW